MDIGLRPWREDDAARLAEIVVDAPELNRQLPFLPESHEEAARLIRESFRSAEDRWIWCVEAEGRVCGLVGISVTPEEEVRSGPSGRGWVWYWSAPDVRRTGVLSRAVRVACDWALSPDGGGLRRLELGYRENNPGSARVAESAGFFLEGREREKFVVEGRPVDVLTASRLATDPAPGGGGGPHTEIVPPEPLRQIPAFVHHIELWTADFTGTIGSWRWLLTGLGLHRENEWAAGESWVMTHGAYLVIEQSPDVSGPLRRTDAGMNHLALRVTDRAIPDVLRRAAQEHGWSELFGDLYPHAGGAQSVALYMENSEGFEVEIVVG